MSRMRDTFTPIYKGKLWGSEDASGTGSTLEQTAAIRAALPTKLKELDIRTVLDIPCGTHTWWAHMDAEHQLGIVYIGADVVPEIIEDNRLRYPNTRFEVLDLTRDDLPQCDAIFVRDCLGHLSNQDMRKALANIVRAKPKYVFITTFPGVGLVPDIQTGSWRPLNVALFQKEFGLRCIALMDEKLLDENGTNVGKRLGIYEL